MSSDTHARERMKLRPIHRCIEARCKELVAKAGRTWRRLPYTDREKILIEAMDGMNAGDIWRWSQRYGLGDVLSAAIMPSRARPQQRRDDDAG